MSALTRLLLVAALATGACGSGADEASDVPADTGAPVAHATADDGVRAPAPPDVTSSTVEPTSPQPAPEGSIPGDAASAPSIASTATSAPPGADPTPPAVYAPPAGRYRYDVTGTVETTGVTTTEEQVPPTSTDDIRVDGGPAAMRMTVLTRDEGRESSQEVIVAVTATEARLVRLTFRSGSGIGHSVNPDPPALLARLPYRDGDRWEIAWNDPATGISGVGTGTVERRETITSPAGSFDTVVVTVAQRLRGTVDGTLTVTSWIDPVTGVQPRQHVITDLVDVTGASRSDSIRTLRERAT